MGGIVQQSSANVSSFNTLRLTAAAILMHALVCGGAAHAAGHATWTTGVEFRDRLAQPVDILWSGNPLRAAIGSLARAQQVAILIDRRVDPGQKLDLRIQGVPMGSALQRIAEHCGLGVSWLGAVVYLAPPSAAQRLRPVVARLEQRARKLPLAAQRKLFQSKAFAWDDLSTPRDLLAQLGRESGVEIVGLERVPHDLWAAADLPPLSLIDRLSLIAVQFDLSFTVAADGTRLELTPVPENLPLATNDPEGLFTPYAAPKPPAAAASPSIDTVRIKRLAIQDQPLGPLLRQLADRLGLELKIDEKAVKAARISLDQRISVKVENATVDDLLRRLLKSTGLGFRRHQRVVEIMPAE
jgi:hypothetical protein